MPKVEIERESACRGCRLCIDRCPVQVFEEGMSTRGMPIAKVVRPGVCMGCFTCYYQCPSQCIRISEVERQRPFYRVDENIGFVRHFVQAEPLSEELSEADWEQSYRDVAMTLMALAKSVESVFGFATEAIAYQAGTLAAPHFPEIYEVTSLEERLQRLQQRLHHCFDFTFKIAPERIEFTFAPCGICQVVTKAGDIVGDSILCRLFHDYWASLIGAFAEHEYRYKLHKSGHVCHVELFK